jgi:antirestriction protein ArdC
MSNTTRGDIYSRVTNKIVADLERGVRPWLKPWNAEHAAGRITRPLRGNGVPYKGINVLMLWGEAELKGYNCPTWMTYRQAQELGGQVRKGETGSLVVYADRMTRTEKDEQGKLFDREIPFLKGYSVFNCEQVDGLPESFYPRPTPPTSKLARIADAEDFAAHTGAITQHGGNRAFYCLTNDRIQIPPFECFRDAESYYSVLLHELTHWTLHPTRLDRELGRKRFGKEGYAAEELVAELGAAFLCADIGISAEPRDDHASYLAIWLEVLKNDNRAIFTAAAHAQRAADYLHSLQPNAESQVAA